MSELTLDDIKGAIGEVVDEKLDDLKKVDREALPGDSDKVEVIEEPGDRKFKSFGDQLTAVIRAADPAGELDPRLKATGLSEGVPSDGGFLVQTDFATELISRVYETGQVASRCKKVKISANANGLKLFGIDETSRATGSRWGGVRAYWIGEAADKTASDPKFRMMTLGLKKLVGLYYATDELLQDASALEDVVKQAFTEEFAFKVDDAIINGTGVGQPLGILNSNCLVSITQETNQAANTLLADNIVKIYARMWARSRPNAVWFINQDIEPELHTMSFASGTAGIAVYMPANGLSGAPYSTLYGRPVIAIEQCATVGDVGDIIFADMSQYILIDKGGIQSASSIHVKFVQDETCFRFVYRVDGQPLWASKLTPYKGSNTLSPFVVVETR